MDEAARQIRLHYRQALATLTRNLGDFALAEDAMQEASARALDVWRSRSLPDRPAAWLITVGRRVAIDELRKGARRRDLDPLRAPLEPTEHNPWENWGKERLVRELSDDGLGLFFTCCHPALNLETQIALTLKVVAGLTVEEVAAALVVSPAAMEQRLTRAKRKIRAAGIGYEEPEPDELAQRLDVVLRVVYLIYNEGYHASAGDAQIRRQLCDEAVRLTRLLARRFRRSAECRGLLALMLLQMARFPARDTDANAYVPLLEQDRARWDRSLIAEGKAILDTALRAGPPGRFQIEAAIAALHSSAQTAAETDWPQIAALYEKLAEYEGGPIISLNRAVALFYAGDYVAAATLLDRIEEDPKIKNYAHFYAARGLVATAAGNQAAARKAYDRALALTSHAGERRYLEKQRDALAIQ